jgi:hypothetical protein
VRREECDTDEDEERAQSHPEQNLCRPEAAAEEPVEKRRKAEYGGARCANTAIAVETSLRQGRALAHGRDRRHARGAESRSKAREQSDKHTDEQRDDDRTGLERQAVVRQREAADVEELEEALPQSEAEEEADDRRDDDP